MNETDTGALLDVLRELQIDTERLKDAIVDLKDEINKLKLK